MTISHLDKRLPNPPTYRSKVAPPRPPRPDETVKSHSWSSHSSDKSLHDTVQPETRDIKAKNKELRATVERLQNHVQGLEQRHQDMEERLRLLGIQNSANLERIDRQNDSLRKFAGTMRQALSKYVEQISTGYMTEEESTGSEGDHVRVYSQGMGDPSSVGTPF